MFTYIFWLGLSVWKFPWVQMCFSTALFCGTLSPCPKRSSLVTVDRPMSSVDGLYGDMPSHVLISSGSLELILKHPPQQHSHFPGNLSSPNGSHMPLVKLSSWNRRKMNRRLASSSFFFSFSGPHYTADFSHVHCHLLLGCPWLFSWRGLVLGLTFHETSQTIIIIFGMRTREKKKKK